MSGTGTHDFAGKPISESSLRQPLRLVATEWLAVPALDDLPDLANVAEVAAVLRVGRNTVYDAITRGMIPHIRLGERAIRIPREALRHALSCIPVEAAPESPDEIPWLG